MLERNGSSGPFGSDHVREEVGSWGHRIWDQPFDRRCGKEKRRTEKMVGVVAYNMEMGVYIYIYTVGFS